MNTTNRKILHDAFAILKPKPRLTVSQWADEHRYIARGTTPEPGRWKTSRAPYTREIMDIFNSSVNLVVVCASSQVGKTEIGLNVLGFFMAEDPSSIMYLMPTEGTANDFSKTRIQPTIDASPALKELFANSKDSDNTIELKTFAGGYVAIYGASTPTKLASKPIRVLLADEIDRFPKLLKSEGEPLKLGMQRTTNFFNRKILLISTPTVKNESKIEEWFEKSDKRYYHVPCPDCGHEFALTWEMMKWEAGKDGELIIDSVYLQCPACYFQIVDRHKPNMLSAGRWVATAPQKTTPGFHISSLYSPWVKFADLVKEYLEASISGDNSKMREFINLKLGLAFEEVLLELDPELLLRRREFYNCELPEGVLYITCGVDTQNDRLEYHIIGWGAGYEAWVLRYGAIYGDLETDKPWLMLDNIIEQKFSFMDGRRLPILSTLIDSGGNHTNEVYKYTMKRKHMGVYPIVGRGGDRNIIQTVSRNNVYKTELVTVGVDAGKSRLFRALNIEDFGAGYIHFPREEHTNVDLHYFEMLTAEKQELVPRSGQYVAVWRKIRDRNEALDTFVYALAALELLAPNFEMQALRVAELPKLEQSVQQVVSKRRIYSGIKE